MTREAYIRMIGHRMKEDPLTYQEVLERAENKVPIKSGEQIAIAILWLRKRRYRKWRNKRDNIRMQRWLKMCMHRNGYSFYSCDPFVARVVEHVFRIIAESLESLEKLRKEGGTTL